MTEGKDDNGAETRPRLYAFNRRAARRIAT